ncbi:unnamed protein product, partial [Prorocentrum cordatum]
MSGNGAAKAAKGAGKGPPPGKKAPAVKGKASAAKEGAAKAPPKATLPKLGENIFGKRLHWQNATTEVEGESVFGELRSSGPDFDPQLLKSLLINQPDQSKAPGGGARRKAVAKKAAGIAVLDGTRAQNIAIVLSKIESSISADALCTCLADLDFDEARLSVEDVELLIDVLPKDDEARKVLDHKKNVSDLRDVEQKVMPFCELPKCVVRLKLMK